MSLPLMTSAFAAKHKNGGKLKDDRIIVDLQSQHRVLSPAETMRSIATSCEELGIDTFDMYGDFSADANSSYIRKFEAEVAAEFGKDDAVFMPSGVMAQNIALLIHDEKEKIRDDAAICGSFMCHHTSHLLLWEESGYSKLLGMDAIEIDTRSAGSSFPVPPMRLHDVVSAIKKGKSSTSGSSAKTGPSSLFLELPHRELGGKLIPWNEVLSISALCKEEGIKFHCDGARIFEAFAGYGKNLKELADPFDSIYISFYKGLGSISGAMLMGSNEFCDEARIWLRRFGGNLYSLLPYAVSCWAGYNRHALSYDNSLTFEQKFEKLQEITKKIESETDFSRVGSFDPAKPQTNMIHVYIKAPYENCIEARDKVAKSTGFNMFTRLKEIPESDAAFEAGFQAKFEWTIGEANGSINDEVFVLVWKEFCSFLIKS